MIADEYFQVRAQLGSALFSLQALAHELHASRESARTLQELAASLREPFLFVVLGEARAGKSSLLNALFGRELCQVDSETESREAHLFKYGPRQKDIPGSDGVIECLRPIFLLRDFHLLDMPGIRTPAARAQKLVPFLTKADLLLFIVSSTEPWSDSLTGFLSKLPPERLAHLVLVVQQIDLRKDVEIEAVTRHLKQSASEQAGMDLPVFAVSALRGFVAKTNAVDKERLLAESGMDRLESYIDQAITRGEERWGALRRACQDSQEILAELAEKVRGAFYVIHYDDQNLMHLTLTLEDRRQQSLRQVNGILWTLGESYDRVAKRVEETLRNQLGIQAMLRIVFTRGTWRQHFHELVASSLAEAIHRQIVSSIDAFEIDLGDLSRELRASLESSSFAAELANETSAPVFIKERADLLDKVDRTMSEQAAESQLEERISALLGTLALWVRIPALFAVLMAMGAAVALITGSRVLAAVLAAGAVVALVVALIVALARRAGILSFFNTAMVRRREELLAPIEDHLRTAIHAFYEELKQPFEPLRAFVAAQRVIYEPMILRVKQLEETFAKTAADLGLARRD
jgi:GTPase SAR1 family protein